MDLVGADDHAVLAADRLRHMHQELFSNPENVELLVHLLDAQREAEKQAKRLKVAV